MRVPATDSDALVHTPKSGVVDEPRQHAAGGRFDFFVPPQRKGTIPLRLSRRSRSSGAQLVSDVLLSNM